MSKPNQSTDTRDQLRKLMSQHTATAAANPRTAPVPAAPPAHQPVQLPIVQAAKTTVRLAATELSKLDQIILNTHQRAGERITVSDVLRIGLARISGTSPVTAAEIASSRVSDGRRTKAHLSAAAE